METRVMNETDCPRTRALLEEIKALGYSAANDRCTSLCWELEREIAVLQFKLTAFEDQQRAAIARGDAASERIRAALSATNGEDQ